MEEIESSINRYLTALDEADQQKPSIAQPKAARLQEKIDKLKAQMKELQVIEIQLDGQAGPRGDGVRYVIGSG